MSRSRAEKEREKVIQDNCQLILNGILKEEDNKYCVDCDSKGPRWASWNLGVFLCIRCAGIHRNLGVHITKVRSVNLDSWTPQQVASMQSMGNSRGRAVYEANIPDDYRRPTTDSGMEAFIRNKYEKKKYIAKEWVPTKPPDVPIGWSDLLDQEKQNKIKDGKVSLPTTANNNNLVSKIGTTEPTPSKPTSVVATAAKLVTVPASTSSVNHVTSTTSSVPSGLGGGSSDLLGLTLGTPSTAVSVKNSLDDDLFSNFVSASTCDSSNSSSQAKPAQADAAKQDLFNQVSSVESASTAEASKMSNSSILALFSSAGPAAPPTTVQPVNGQVGLPNQFMGQFQSPVPLPQQQFHSPVQLPQQQQQFQSPMPGAGIMPGQPNLFNNNLTAGNSHQAAGNPFLELSGTPGLAKPTQPKLMHPLPQNVAQMTSQLGGLALQNGLRPQLSSQQMIPGSYSANPSTFPAPTPQNSVFASPAARATAVPAGLVGHQTTNGGGVGLVGLTNIGLSPSLPTNGVVSPSIWQ